jgi:predicted XRE-type DNA-binding protein
MSAFTVKVKAGIKRERPTPRRKELPKPPSRLARQLALAYLVERLIDQRKIKNHAQAARRLGVTRARMSQVMGLINLSAAAQDGILLNRIAVSHRHPPPARQ